MKSSTVTIDLGPRDARGETHRTTLSSGWSNSLPGFSLAFIPWSLQEPAVESWAAAEGFEIWAVNEDSVKPGTVEGGTRSLHERPQQLGTGLVAGAGPKICPGGQFLWPRHILGMGTAAFPGRITDHKCSFVQCA